MKELLKTLQKLNEEENGIDINTFIKACELSTDFMHVGEEVQEAINDGETVTLEPESVNGEDVYRLVNQFVYICTDEAFETMVHIELSKIIADLPSSISSYIDDRIYNNTFRDMYLRNLILENLDISNYDSARVNGVEYILYE